MPLTPADIHNMAFRKSPLGKRGYDEEEVDVLLDAVSQEMIKLLEENNALRDRVPRPAAVPPQAAPDRAIQAELSAVSGELNRARQAFGQAEQRAQSLHDRLADARRAVERERAAVKPAGVNTDRVLALANRSADQHMESAHEDARKLSLQARSESERVTRQARLTAQEITEESRRRDRDAAAELRDGRTARLLEIEQLTEFAESYRAALESHLHRQVSL